VIPRQRSHMTTKALSHPGLSGKNNEDRYAVCAFELEGDLRTPSVIAVVADGIGGHRAGEVAAELAIETICHDVAQSDASQPVRILEQAVIHAGQVIAASAQRDTIQHGMGTTCACAWVIGDQLYTVSVGDSRIYLIRSGRIQQLTIDHTWVQEAISLGALLPEEARRHPNAHVIRRYLGSKQDVVPDMRLRIGTDQTENYAEQNQGARMLPGDVLLLCTDGLTDLVNDEEILHVIESRGTQAGVNELVAMANQRGGHDNITVITLRLPDEKDRSFNRLAPIRYWRIGAGCLVLVALVSALLLGGTYWYLEWGAPGGTAPALIPRESQVTLFPESSGNIGTQVVQPEVPPSAAATPVFSLQETQGNNQPSAPGTLPVVLEAILTPWPTNTP
jgi:PPM family protein phosphatase